MFEDFDIFDCANIGHAATGKVRKSHGFSRHTR